MGTLDNDGDVEFVQGSGAKPYELKNVAGVLSCSCPAWRNVGGPIDKRTCKHLKALRGAKAEGERVGGPAAAEAGRVKSAAPSPPSVPSAELKLFGCGCEHGSTCDVSHDPSLCACEQCVLAEEESRLGRKLRPDEKTKLFGPPVMRAHSLKDFPDLDVTGWWASEKMDGVRAYWNGKDFITRHGNVYRAPDWFKAGLPDHPVDGELWMGRQMFQRTISVVKSGPSEHWKEIVYVVFDLPAHPGKYEQRQLAIHGMVTGIGSKHIRIAEQRQVQSRAHLATLMEGVLGLGGEGLMVCRPGGQYTVGKTDAILKVKRFTDAEAVVIGHTPGKGRHKGRLGGLEVRMPDGKTFNVGSGLKDEERRSPPKIGSTITYRFTETTDSGLPKCASFVAVRDYE